MKRSLSLACLLLLGLATFVQAEQGNPKIKAIEAIAFGPNGLLLIGGGARVVSVETGDTKPTTWSKTEIANIDQVLAGKLGLTAKDIEIRKLAVNPASKKAYVALQSLKTKASVILTIDGAGNVAEFPLDNVKYTSYTLATPKVSITKVTDIAWAGGKIVAATQASDKFTASRVFTINPAAKDGSPTQISTKTYHVGHGKWETHAPLRVLMPYRGKRQDQRGRLVHLHAGRAATTSTTPRTTTRSPATASSSSAPATRRAACSPTSATARSTSSSASAATTRSRRSASRAPTGWPASTPTCSRRRRTSTRRPRGASAARTWSATACEVAKEYFGTLQMDRLDATRALAIVEDKGALSLRALPLP